MGAAVGVPASAPLALRALLLGFHRPRRRFAEQSGEREQRKEKAPFRAIALATSRRPRRKGFEAADLRPRSSPVGFH